MKTTKLSEMSDEALLKNEKTMKSVTYAFAGILTVLIVILIVTSIRNGFKATNIVPIALLPIVIVNLNSLKEMKKEIELRKLR